MLVLQRKKNQSILIGDQIELSVLEIGSDWVKLALSAPKDISILRKELTEAARANRESAGVSSLDAVKKIIKKEEK
ncbi:MAG: carbon storage regulator [Lachnospiraceae bacterium]|jgi:carbon storage regulator|nr:carbon storage regulator [Lachnospiraceae bacterium]